MRSAAHRFSVEGMEKTLIAGINRPLAFGLAALALIRPLASIVGVSDALGKPATPVVLTAVITVVWVLVVGLSRIRRPVATLVAAGVVYAVVSIVLSAVLSPVIDGELNGPLANPIAVIAVFLVNVVWGFVAGGMALLIQRVRGVPVRRELG